MHYEALRTLNRILCLLFQKHISCELNERLEGSI